MSYAGRLVAMSRGEVPRVAMSPRAEPEAVHEDHVETVASSPPAASIAMAPTAPERRSPTAPAVTPERELAREIHTSVERVREIASTTISSPVPPPLEVHMHEPWAVVERSVLPAPAPWLAEDPSAPDPLVASADTDALRELMRSVRQWTSGPPTILETPEQQAPAQAQPVVEAAPAVEPVQVTIGNVVVTVEDAPVAGPRGRSPSLARSTGDRLARNHIRGT